MNVQANLGETCVSHLFLPCSSAADITYDLCTIGLDDDSIVYCLWIGQDRPEPQDSLLSSADMSAGVAHFSLGQVSTRDWVGRGGERSEWCGGGGEDGGVKLQEGGILPSVQG